MSNPDQQPTDSEAGEPAKPPKPKPRVVAHGFSCGSGPCKVIRVYENEPELPKLPAPTGAKPEK